jgi:DNA-binding transcriptional LysR family regulator
MAKTPDWDSRIGRRVTLRDLHILFAVVQHGSMAKAGGSLGKSQSAVSQAIAAIEHAVGVRLLDRTSRGVEPTAYGSALLRRGRAAFDELRLGINEIESMADPATGEVRIACSDLVSAGILPPIVDRVSLQYPRIKLDVHETSSATMEYPELQERKVDIRLAILQRPLEGETAKKFHAEILCNDQICLATGLSSPLARRRKIDLSDLLGAPWIAPPPEASGGASIIEAFRAQGLSPPEFTVTTFSVGLRSFLGMGGRFVIALPVSVLALYSKVLALKRLPIELPKSQLSIAIVTLKDRTLSPAAQLFIACAREVTKSLRRGKG